MNENRGFDILENADDKEIELLAEVPVLSGKEKESMLKMSKKKLAAKSSDKAAELQVSGVERYSRPKWYRFASIAACAVLLTGLAGSTVYLLKGRTPADPIPGLTIPAAEITAKDTDALDMVLKHLTDSVNEARLVSCGGGVETDNNSITVTGRTLYRVTDKRFSNIKEVREYFRQYFSENMQLSTMWSIVSGEQYSIFNEYNDELYFEKSDTAQDRAPYYIIGSDAGEIDAEYSDTGADSVFEKAVTFSVNATMNDYPCVLNGTMVLEDGSWKLDKFSADYLLDDAKNNVIVNTLLEKLEEFDKACVGEGIETDRSELLLNADDGGVNYKYYKVTDQRFSSLSDVKDYFADYFTNDYLSRFPSLWEGYGCSFREVDGVLGYVSKNINGTYTYISDPAVENVEEDSFDIITDRELSPEKTMEKLVIHCILSDNRWRIDWISADNSSWHEPDYTTSASSALKAFYEIEGVVYGNVDVSDGEPLIKNYAGRELTYKEVRSDKYSSVSDIMGYIRENCCDELLAHYENDMYIDGAARYIDEDGRLYALDVTRPFDEAFGAVSDYETLDETDEDFTVRVTPPHDDSFYINVKNLNGEWKLSGCSKYRAD